MFYNLQSWSSSCPSYSVLKKKNDCDDYKNDNGVDDDGSSKSGGAVEDERTEFRRMFLTMVMVMLLMVTMAMTLMTIMTMMTPWRKGGRNR